MGVYDEYLTRSLWAPSEPFQRMLARRVLVEFVQIASLNPPTTSILEIGSGTGRSGVAAREMGFESYTGVEPTRALAAYARTERGLPVVEDRLPELLSLQSDMFGAVFSMHVLEHAPTYEDARRWCEGMARVLLPGGKILIAAPDIRDYRAYFWDSDWSHGFPTTPRRVSQVLADIGLDVVYEGTMHLGRTGGMSTVVAKVLSALVPTRAGDAVTKRAFGRPLASGLKIAGLWGLSFVIAEKPLPG